MKRFVLAAVAALMAVIGCANAPVEKKIQEFKDGVEALEKRFTEELVTIKQNVELTAEQQAEAMEKLQDKAATEIKDFCMKTIKKNKDDEA
ncbi:MAG: hypothetical protein J6Y32_03615, partial [Bacteroidales bacterium]|nr:hypothetical protein [Bacteroidales bacterium]